MVDTVLRQMGYPQPVSVTPFRNEENGESYAVWHLEYPDCTLVLKQAKGFETEIYPAFFAAARSCAPRLYASANVEGKDYLLMEYIPGHDLRHCNRDALKFALDSLIAMQDTYWQDTDHAGVGETFGKSMEGRQNRVKYLADPLLESVYDEFLREYAAVPRTLCHDDLLPFNVIVSHDRAVLIDWEVGGILPYGVSLARLIAHGEEKEDAFFYMKDADKVFALDYYYEHFICRKGIDRQTYLRTMKLFVFYECCEWIYLGNRYPDADMERFRIYLEKAGNLARTL